MARNKNDGRGRLGGRQRGTPNKTTQTLRTRIDKLLQDNFDLIQEDFTTLIPRDRLLIYERLLQYVLPKRQQTAIDLSKLSDEQITNLATNLLDEIDEV
jgi:hypothetical protein